MNILATMMIASVALAPAPSAVPDLVAPPNVGHTLANTPCCQEELARARELHESGNWAEAHRQYLEVARMQSEAGEFAGDALWEAAQISYVQARYRRAARELDRIAEEARDFGQPSMRARALFEAAVIYHRYLDGRDGDAKERLAQLDRILPSPDLSEEVREFLVRRMHTGGTPS